MAEAEALNELYGQEQRPYYIYAPRWIESSAGIKALHFLCHSLNRSGQMAYLVLCEPIFNNSPRISPTLLTPILTQEIADSHFRSNLTPVTIYSETIPGNPIGASFIVRYLMNFVGTLGGPETFDENDFLLAFSQMIVLDTKERIGLEVDQVLFLPPIDPREFVFNSIKQDFQIVYAGKYRSFIGSPRKVGSQRSVEIYRDGPRMQNREQVKKLLSDASVVFAFENSSIATEAILSGTPVCFIKTELTEKIIAEFELGDNGIARGEDSDSIEEARSTVPIAIESYFQSIETFQLQLNKFIETTQRIATETGYPVPIQVPSFESMITTHRISLASQILRKNGIKALVRVTYHFVMRRLSWRFWNKGAPNRR
jgi:hypothetical protein